MPIVTIQVTREGTKPGATSVTADEKAALIKGASELLRDVLNKPLDSTFVVIEEVATDNWGWGGCPRSNFGVSARRRQGDASRRSTQDHRAFATAPRSRGTQSKRRFGLHATLRAA